MIRIHECVIRIQQACLNLLILPLPATKAFSAKLFGIVTKSPTSKAKMKN